MRSLTLFGALLSGAPTAFAQGIPTDRAIGFQNPVTELAERAYSFHDQGLLAMCIGITLFVAGLLIYVSLRYNKGANPTPSKVTHNTTIEVVWTVIPVLILVAIAVFSFPLLYAFDRAPNLQAIASGEIDATVEQRAAAEQGWITVKAQGNQWNWTYTYPDETDDAGFPLEFTSNPLHVGLSTDPAAGERLLSVDYPMVVPAGRYVRYYTAAADVIHSFAMPAFGIKTDAIPGRLNEGWFRVEQEGVYYGQCSELCGKNHAYMPIEIRVVPEAQYQRWLLTMKSGDFDRAAQMVAEIEPVDRTTQFAAAN
ncbi:MAG: cytochrome c oxidase subunit II [Pseudomonadota bacterium]